MYAGKVELCGVDTARLPVLSEAEKARLIKAARAGDRQARQEMVQGNLRLVLSVVQKFASRGENMDDLFQVGCIGLIKAIDNFDPAQNVRFSTRCGRGRNCKSGMAASRKYPRSPPRWAKAPKTSPWRWNPPSRPPVCTSRSTPTVRTALPWWISCGTTQARKTGSAI